MPRRLPVNNIRKVIQMFDINSDFSQNALAEMCNCSRTAISNIIDAVRLNELTFEKIETLTDAELERIVYPSNIDKSTKKPLDYEYLIGELKKPHVTRMTLWREYINSNPNGYQRTQFFDLLKKYMDSKKVSLHINRKPGEKMHVDWTGDPMSIFNNTTGEEIKVYLFVSSIGCSSYPYVEAFMDRKKTSFIQGHINAFEYYKAIPLVLVPDNDKSAVVKVDAYDPVINETYQRLADYYGIGIIPARRRTPKDKATVEKAVLDAAEREVIGGLRNEKFFSLSELNSRIKDKLMELSERPFQKKPGSRKSVFMQLDFPTMRPLPEKPFEFVEIFNPTVNIDYHIEVDNNFYSVPYKLVGKKVKAEMNSSNIKVFYNNEQIASHIRIMGYKYNYKTDPAHMPKEHQLYHKFNKEYFIKWGENVSEEAKIIISSIFEKKNIEEQGYRSCLGIQRLVNDQGINKFKNACKIICDKNLNKTYQNVKRLMETVEPIPSEVPITHDNIRGKDYYS